MGHFLSNLVFQFFFKEVMEGIPVIFNVLVLVDNLSLSDL